jgi:ketosteroid isomerase-like protein
MHVRAFTEAVQRKDLEAMLANMTEDIVLETPLFKEPFRGKEALRTVVGALLRIVDSFDFQEVMEGPLHVSAFYVVRIGAEILDGVDYWRLDEAGLIIRMKVLWRPLPALAAVQRRLDAAA